MSVYTLTSAGDIQLRSDTLDVNIITAAPLQGISSSVTSRPQKHSLSWTCHVWYTTAVMNEAPTHQVQMMFAIYCLLWKIVETHTQNRTLLIPLAWNTHTNEWVKKTFFRIKWPTLWLLTNCVALECYSLSLSRLSGHVESNMRYSSEQWHVYICRWLGVMYEVIYIF